MCQLLVLCSCCCVSSAVLVCNVTALLQCLTLIRQHQLTTADVTVQDLKIANYGKVTAGQMGVLGEL